jgi:transglutaminase-like putative cysteine protease
MSRLRIEHRTEYCYSRPVELGRHRLVVRPREGHDLHVEEMRLEISPAHELVWSRDVFGNSIAIVDFTEATTRLQIVSNVVVCRFTPFPQQEPHVPWRVPFPVTYDPLELAVASAYQMPSYPDDFDVLRQWLDQTLPTRDPEDAEGVVFALGNAVYQQIKYQRRNQRGVQSPGQTLNLASGSCRDMATLMMEAGRVLGVAMRFASGYLDCAASLAGRASMHAWTEAYLPALGWRGVDPTLGEPTSLKHVVTGVSNHPRGVMPVSGMFTGTSSDYDEMVVQVKTEKLPHDQFQLPGSPVENPTRVT